MRNITLAGVVAAVALYLTLIPLWGMLGAAVASALSMALQNLATAFAVRRALGIWTLPIPGFGGRHRSGDPSR
jgi:O-antigen/teichoic acid export membrane protein